MLLFASSALLFAPAVGFEFVRYDDLVYVAHQPHVLGGPTLANLRWAFTTSEGANWHPLTWISHMIDAAWWGADPRGPHATSIFLHALNTALVFLALRRLTGAFWTSAACALFFGWHPLRVESVAWVAERKDVLSGFFFLLTLWAWAARFVAADPDADRARVPGPAAGRCSALALLAFALGLLSKPMLVTLPFVLLLLDVWPLRRLHVAAWGRGAGRAVNAADSSIAALVVEKAPFFALALASAATTYLVQSNAGAAFLRIPPGVRAANAVVSVARYLGTFLWPAGLAVIYPYPAGWSALATGAAVALVLGASALGLRQAHARPWLLVGWLWFVGMLVPVLGIVQVGLQSIADRYTYLPILGLQIAILWTVRDQARDRRSRAIVAATAAALLLALALRTRSQLAVWHDTRTLFEHAAAVTDDNYRAHQFAADELLDEHRFAEARTHYRRLLEIAPSFVDPELVADNALTTHFNLGLVALALGDAPDAATHFRAVLEKTPDDPEANSSYGAILTGQRSYDEARRHLDRALAVAPESAGVHGNLAVLELATGHLDEAIAHDRRAHELAPADAAIACRLAASLETRGPADEARSVRVEAARLAGPAGCPQR